MRNTILYFILLFGVTLKSQSIEILFEEYQIKEIKNNPSLLSLKNANYDDNLLPFITKKINGFYEAENIKTEFIACSNYEIDLLDSIYISTEFLINTSHNFSRNKKTTSFNISPWILEDGVYKKLKKINFSLKEIISNNFKFRKTQISSNSKLAKNSWYKFAIAHDGVQKITFKELTNQGLISEQILSSKIELLCNTAKMLPLINGDDCMDDLINMQYQLFDHGDGFFNKNDYILFYAEANGIEYYDSSTDLIRKEINLYSDTNFVYLGFNSSNNNLIKNTSPISNFNDTIYNYTKILHHEKELLNFIKSGRNWVGERFDNNILNFSAGYNTPYLESKAFSIEYNVCARSSNYSNNIVQLMINGEETSNSQISTVSSIYYNDYVKFKKNNFSGILTGDTINVNFYYKQLNNPNAWLDYFTLNTRERIAFNAKQVQIINSDNDNFTHTFDVKSINKINVWDITNLAEIKNLFVNVKDSSCYFDLELDTIKKIIVFGDDQFFLPIYKNQINPQNLHNEAPVNYIIITTHDFKEEAQRLISLHQTEDNLTGKTFYTDEIFNEFSSGRPEATAIRNFIKMLYKKGENTPDSVQYVLLLGDGSFDPKNRLLNNTNLIPTFQSSNSVKLTSSYVTDDIFGLMDDNEGDYENGDLLDISVGRLPVKSKTQAKNIIDKIFEYYNKYDTKNVSNNFKKKLLNSNGSWKNNIVFIADDEDFNEHMRQTDILANLVDTSIEKLNIKKIFLDSYSQETSLFGNKSPEANKALIKSINEGALLINYTGHGGELGWTAEKILMIDDIVEMNNRHKLPLFMTATCEFSRFDDPHHTSAGEYLILQKQGGAIALFTTVRLVFSIPNFKLNQTFYQVLNKSINNSNIKLGDVFRLTKVENNGGTNDRNFTLLGDPALKLNFPLMNVKIDNIKINGNIIDTLKALSTSIISGHIEDNQNTFKSDYNGWAEINIFDKKRNNISLDNDKNGINFKYKTQEDLLFKGNTKITNGRFNIEIIIPKDTRLNYDFGKISVYAIDSIGQDASGYSKDYQIGGQSENYLLDNSGPDLEIFLEDTMFSFGDKVNPSPLFIAKLNDSSGINIMTNDIGKDITLTIDENSKNTIILNNNYKTNGSYKSGEIIYPLSKLENGRHSMVLKAYDNQNNSSQVYAEFIIESNPLLALDHILNYPNPFTTSTSFYLEHNQSSNDLNIMIQILTISGRLIKTIQTVESSNNQRIGPIRWDGKDDYGASIGKGVYIYNVSVENTNGDKVSKLQKLVILK